MDRYIASQFFKYFLAGLVVFATIFLAADFVGNFVRYGDVETGVLLRFYAYLAPEIIYKMMPIACLVGTTFTLSNLNRTNELIALFGAGLSLVRVVAPIFILVSALSVTFFWMNDHILPQLAQKKNYVYYVEIRKRPGLYSTVKANRIWYRSNGILFNIKALNTNDATMQGLTMYYLNSNWSLVQKIQARSAKARPGQWELKDGLVTRFTDNSSFPQTERFETKVITMGEDVEDIQSTTSSSDIMDINQLKKFIEKNKAAGLDTLSYEVDYHGRFGFLFAALVMTLLSIPFSVKEKRSGGRFVNVSLCIGLAFAYWLLFSFSLSFGRNGLIPPTISAWAPNTLFLGASTYLFSRLKK